MIYIRLQIQKTFLKEIYGAMSFTMRGYFHFIKLRHIEYVNILERIYTHFNCKEIETTNDNIAFHFEWNYIYASEWTIVDFF